MGKPKRPIRKRVTQKMRDMLGIVKVDHGGHDQREEGMCVMEAVAYISGEAHTDHPACVSESITELMIETNDSVGDHARQKLLEVVPDIIGTGWSGEHRTRAEAVAEKAQREAMREAGVRALDRTERELRKDAEANTLSNALDETLGALERFITRSRVQVKADAQMLLPALRELGRSDEEIVEAMVETVRAGAKVRAPEKEIRADIAAGRFAVSGFDE